MVIICSIQLKVIYIEQVVDLSLLIQLVSIFGFVKFYAEGVNVMG